MVKEIGVVVAYNKNRGIGKDGKLLYHIPEDLKNFKRITSTYPIVMGRKTFESLPNGPLPNRPNIVLTKSMQSFDGTVTVDNLGKALQYANENGYEKIFFIGGEQVYKDVMNYGWPTVLYVTYIDDDKVADTFFPPFDESKWNMVSNAPMTTNDGIKYFFREYEKKY